MAAAESPDAAPSDGLDGYLKDDRSPLARLLGDGPVPHKVFTFDGAGDRFKGKPFAVRAISTAQTEKATAAAFGYLVGKGGWTDDRLYTERGKHALGLETAVQILSLALCDPEDPTRRLVKSADEFRNAFEPDEVGPLFSQFLAFNRERHPLAHVETMKEAERIFVDLGKGYALPTTLLDYDIDTVRNIALSGALLFSKLMMRGSSDSDSQS